LGFILSDFDKTSINFLRLLQTKNAKTFSFFSKQITFNMAGFFGRIYDGE